MLLLPFDFNRLCEIYWFGSISLHLLFIPFSNTNNDERKINKRRRYSVNDTGMLRYIRTPTALNRSQTFDLRLLRRSSFRPLSYGKLVAGLTVT